MDAAQAQINAHAKAVSKGDTVKVVCIIYLKAYLPEKFHIKSS